jgi:hypothetical protein
MAAIAVMRISVLSLAFVLAQAGPALPRFEQVQAQLFSAGGTLVNAAADYDGDGDIDLFVGFNGEPNRLYRNDAGTFVNAAVEAGVADARSTRAAAWGDFDADGDADLLVGFAPASGTSTPAPSIVRLYRNDRGKFVDVAPQVGLAVAAGAIRQPVWIDVDADGDLDLYLAFRDRPDMFFRSAAGRFTDVAAQIGLADPRKTVGAVWFDHDEDGDLDLYAAHMDGDANALYRNDKGRFTDVAEASGLAWGGRVRADATNGTVRPCAVDVDGDGRFDLFTANYGPNGLFRNRGGGRFEDVSASSGVAIDGRYDTCAFGDVDHDGDLDLYVNGTVTGGKSHPDFLFRNTGGRFDDVTPANLKALDADHGALWMDADADGDLDLALTGQLPYGMHLLLRNLLAPGSARALRVRVTDVRGRAVRAGAEIRVLAAGTRRLLGARLVDAGSGYDAQNDMPEHVGVGNAARVDVEVTWPAAGTRRLTRVGNVDVTTAILTVRSR